MTNHTASFAGQPLGSARNIRGREGQNSAHVRADSWGPDIVTEADGRQSIRDAWVHPCEAFCVHAHILFLHLVRDCCPLCRYLQSHTAYLSIAHAVTTSAYTHALLCLHECVVHCPCPRVRERERVRPRAGTVLIQEFWQTHPQHSCSPSMVDEHFFSNMGRTAQPSCMRSPLESPISIIFAPRSAIK